jgi:uroporphyrinogen decarboxylase
MSFEPDFRHFEDVLKNVRPARLPIYEHIISPRVMEQILGASFAGRIEGDAADVDEFFRCYCRFFEEMTYDVVSFEVCITDVLPGSGALMGGRPGPIQNRRDFEDYPWDAIENLYWDRAGPLFDALATALPAGMKAVGGVGNGVFEISEDLVGLEYLPYMQSDDPLLYEELFERIGNLMAVIWKEFLQRHAGTFAACRFGDDLGFKSSLLTNPRTVRENILPQYARVIDLVHAARKPFLWHSCGCIFEIMDDVIALGIDAKHSNEDSIAPFPRWIESYGERIGLLGGFDMDFLCRKRPEEIEESVVRLGRAYRETARGYALGSGNSIPDYVPPENYLAMIRGARQIRELEQRA